MVRPGDEALEDAIYDSQALRDFVGIDLSRQSVPDATTLLKFRRLLQDNELSQALFDEINAHLSEKGRVPLFLRGRYGPLQRRKRFESMRIVRRRGEPMPQASSLQLFLAHALHHPCAQTSLF